MGVRELRFPVGLTTYLYLEKAKMRHDLLCPDPSTPVHECDYCDLILQARQNERSRIYTEQSTSDGWVTARQLIEYEDDVRAKALTAAADTVAALPGSSTLNQELWEHAPTMCPDCGPRVKHWVTITCDMASNEVKKLM